MEPSFWHARWNSGRIGFHNEKHHPLLTAHWPALDVPRGSRVLVPLAGKSLDMWWLAVQGLEVVGVELSEVAARDFFAERNISPDVSQASADSPTVYRGGVTIVVADLFDLTAEAVGKIDAVYDRAALIALPPEMRRRYVPHLQRLAPQAPTLLVTVEYDQSLRGGPPFSVDHDEVRELYPQVERVGEAESMLRDLPVREAAYIAR